MIFSKKQKPTQIPVSFIGVDKRTSKIFELFFKTFCRGKYCHVDEHEKAAITIVDIDRFDTKKQLEKLCQLYPQRQILALSLYQSELELANCTLVRKPIKQDKFSAILNSIDINVAGQHKPTKNKMLTASDAQQKNAVKKRDVVSLPPNSDEDKVRDLLGDVKNNKVQEKVELNSKITEKNTVAASTIKNRADTLHAAQLMEAVDASKFVGNNPDIDMKRPHDLQKIMYFPEHKFQGAVQKGWSMAVEQQATVEVIFLGRTVFFDGVNHTVVTTMSDGILRPLCLMEPIEEPILQIIDGSSANILQQSTMVYTCNTESFIWKIALWSSRGRIPHDTDINKPVYLSEWPNMTRLQLIPHSLRISASLKKRPRFLGDLANELHIPQRYVFSFYSATLALGITDVDQRSTTLLFEPKKQHPTKNRSLLRKLLGHLIVTNVDAHKSKTTVRSEQ